MTSTDANFSGIRQVGVFVEYTPLPQAKFPTQLEETYAALEWVAEHAENSAPTATGLQSPGTRWWEHDCRADADGEGSQRPEDRLSSVVDPATDASVDTDSYHEFGTGRFLARAFMKYGWDLYAPDEKTRNNPYVSPLRASNEELKGSRRRL